VALLDQLKTKLLNSKKITADEAEAKRVAARAAQDAAHKVSCLQMSGFVLQVFHEHT
jgi:hypothetical protein